METQRWKCCRMVGKIASMAKNAHILISVDWGSSKLGIALFDGETRKIVASIKSDDGIHTFQKTVFGKKDITEKQRQDQLLSILESQIDILQKQIKFDLTNFPIVVSGMASSNLGLLELPYKKIPIQLQKPKLNFANITFSKFKNCTVVSGLSTKKDVMRGEECQVIGVWQIKKDFKYILLPGTHSKHVSIKKEKIVGIKTFMTGEIFSVMEKYSMLSNSICNVDIKSYNRFFSMGLDESKKGSLLNTLFTVRTNQLFNKLDKAENYAYLSGLIIGEELTQLSLYKGDKIAVVGGSALRKIYEIALKHLFPEVKVYVFESDYVTAVGHCYLMKNGLLEV